MEGRMPLHQSAIDYLKRGLSNQQIKEELVKSGIEERDIPDILKEIAKMRHARNTTSGLYLMLAGAVVCLASCVITLMSSQTNAFVLYGLTSAGIIVVFAGLAKIF